MNPQTKELRNLLEALAANRNPTQAALDALRRVARNAVDPSAYAEAEDAVGSFTEATLTAGAQGSLSPVRLLELPDDEIVRILHFRLWQTGAQLARKARRQARRQESAVSGETASADIETDLRRHHDAPLMARDLRDELGPDLLRLVRLRLQGWGFAAIADHEQVGVATVHGRVQQALERLRAHAKRTRTSEETGRLALLLIAS